MPDKNSLYVQLKKRNPSSAIVGPHKNCGTALYRASEYCSKVALRYCSKLRSVLSFGPPGAPSARVHGWFRFHREQLGRPKHGRQAQCAAYVSYLGALDHEPDDLVYAALLLFLLSVLGLEPLRGEALLPEVKRALDDIREQRRAQDHRGKDREDLQI